MRIAGLLVLLLAACTGQTNPTPGASTKTSESPTPPAPSATPSLSQTPPAPSSAPSVLPAPAASSAPSPASTAPPVTLGGIGITVPPSVKPGEKRPFVLYLHGLGASGKTLVDVLKIASLADEKRFVYAAPDGALDKIKRRFWNAWGACCDMDKSGVDHVTALRGLLAQAAAHPQVDPSRIFVVGFSNGGFMAHRLACEVDGIAGIASTAGAGPGAGEVCTPKKPIVVLQVHGDADDVIAYQGGHALKIASLPAHPSALETVGGWAKRNGCTSSSPAATGTLDFEEKLPGDETQMSLYTGCKQPVALWTVHGGSHYIGTNRKGQDAIFNYLEKNLR